jgi:hypothetical protein
MQRLSIVVALVALIVTSNLSAADSAEVTALKQQVKTLRAQKDATIKALHAQYDAVINQTKLNDAQLSANKKALAAQENTLATTNASAESKAMQQNMETLRQAMRGEIKVDAAMINTLRTQRHNHIKLVAAAYDAQIKQIDDAIKAAPKATTSAKPKSK